MFRAISAIGWICFALDAAFVFALMVALPFLLLAQGRINDMLENTCVLLRGPSTSCGQ